jgi:hypothetical protein
MKPLVKSRLVWVLAAVIAAQLALYLRRYLPADQAALVSDELVATLCAALGLGGIGLRAQDKRRARTAGSIVDAKAAKAAAKIGVGLAFDTAICLLAAAIVLLAGCQPHWELCEVDLSNHPAKPRPAAAARVRCSRTVLCNHAEGATCDGKELAKKGAQ